MVDSLARHLKTHRLRRPSQDSYGVQPSR